MLGKILSSPLKLAATRRKSSISVTFQGFEFAFVAINLIQDRGRGKGREQKGSSTGFSPVTSTNVGISP